MASGAGKTHLAERPVDHEQLVETLPPLPPRDAVMIARRISMRIADGGPRSRLSGNQRGAMAGALRNSKLFAFPRN